jgi:hypothetical protein
MANFAILDNTLDSNANIVNIIVAESLEDAKLVAINSNIGKDAVEITNTPEISYNYYWNGESFVERIVEQVEQDANL